MIPIIAPTHYFKLSNGQIIKHLDELPEAIERMPQTLFQQYVNENKNDFAKWVFDVFRLVDLSSILGDIKTKQESARVIRAYLHQKNSSPQNNIIRNSQETIIIKPKQEHSQSNEQEKSTYKTVKYNWHEKTTPTQNTQPNVEIKKPQPIQVKEEVKKQVEQVIIKENNVQQNITSENTINADKYFDENPVLVSQMVSAKKKNIKQELLEKIDFSETEKPEKIIDLFKDTYTKAYEKLVFLRKNGFDTKLVQLMLFRIPSRIKVYEAAQEKKEAIQITRYLNEVIEELNTIHD